MWSGAQSTKRPIWTYSRGICGCFPELPSSRLEPRPPGKNSLNRKPGQLVPRGRHPGGYPGALTWQRVIRTKAAERLRWRTTGCRSLFAG